MRHTVPSARFDMAWKVAISHAFRPFLAFFFPELGARIDWSRRPRFRDKELAAIGFGTAAGGLVADMLVEVGLRGSGEQIALIHIEVQAQRDMTLASRIFDYRNRISKQHSQPVISLVLLADDDLRWRPHAFHDEMSGNVLDFSFATAKLLDYAARDDELMASHNPIALVALANLRTHRARHDSHALYAAKWQLTQLLYQHRWTKKRIIILFNVINWMMPLPEQHQQRYWRAVIKLEKERNMELLNSLEQSFVDRGMQQGLKKGLQQGLEQGRREGAAALLEQQLIRRFGALPKTVRKQLANASLAQLKAWNDALPEAQSLRLLVEHKV